MPYPYITAADVKLRIGSKEADRIYNDSDGVRNQAALNALAIDASARVASAIRAARRYNLDLVAANTPSEVIRLSLDVAEMYATKRHPEAVRKDWEKLNEVVKAELKDLVEGNMMLDTTEILSGEDGITPGDAGEPPELSSDAPRGW